MYINYTTVYGDSRYKCTKKDDGNYYFNDTLGTSLRYNVKNQNIEFINGQDEWDSYLNSDEIFGVCIVEE